MACKCADRMRNYILPAAGYSRDQFSGNWVNSEFPDPNYRVISDNDINDHHSRLTAYIAYKLGMQGMKRALSWLTNDEHLSIFNDIKKYRFGE